MCCAGLFLAQTAHALDVDFDSLILKMDAYLNVTSTGVVLKDRDNDSNGIKEADQLGMLSILLTGGSNTNCISSTIRTALNTAYNTNFTLVPAELVVDISGVGTVNIIDQLNGTDPELGVALQKLLAGYLTIADSTTITFVNTLADSLIASVLDGTPQEGDTQNVQNQITFTAAAFLCHGGAAGEPDYIGPRGDIDDDDETNVVEYADGAVLKTREEWLESNCLTPVLRLTSFTGGGLRISGLKETFRVETAGAAGTVTYQWKKAAANVGTAQEFVIGFLTSSSAGSYSCVVTDGVTTRTTPSTNLTVTNVPIFFAVQPLGATRNPGSNFTFNVSVQGGSGPGPYSYQWKKGTTNVGTNSPTLALTNLSTSDAGTYRCSVTSNGGGDTITSSGAVLNVRAINFSLTAQPLSAKKYVGQSHVLSVTASGGSGSFSYVWKKNGSTFGAAGTSSITLSNLAVANAGSYTCTVTDINQPSNTAETDAALLEVAPALQITQQPVGGTVQIGTLIQLSVAAEGGFAPLNYQWRWEGLSITGQTFSIYSAVALSGFEGTFTCRVTDANGTAVVSAGAPIELAPEILINTQPVGAKKYSGQSHTLAVDASGGDPPLLYQWYKDDSSIGAAGQTTSLALPSLTPQQSGIYFCRVSDSVGSFKDTDAVQLLVADTPVITQQPQAKDLDAGDPLALSVTVTGGIPPVTYQWRKNNTPILGTNSPLYSKASVTTVDAGDYTCRITDGLGTVLNSTAATVTVARPIEIAQQPQGGIVAEGDDFTFTVNVNGGVGLLVFDWKQNGASIGAPSQPTLALTGITEDRAGTYTCTISDDTAGSVTTLGAVLTVVDALRIDAQPQSGNYIEGQTVNLSITAGGGLPDYTYQWYLDSNPISGETSSTFTIEDAELSDTGLYQCEIGDQLGGEVLSEVAAVLVAPLITVTLHPKGVDIYSGGAHLLEISATGGNGDYTYIWRYNAVPIEGAPNAPQYTLQNLQASESGFYDCVITESQGGAVATFPAFVRVRDQITVDTQPEGKFLTLGDSHLLTFETSGGFEPVQYQWLKDGEFIVGETTTEYTVTANSVDDGGIYTCLAYDSVSSIVLSTEAVVSVVQPIELVSGPEGGTRLPGENFTFVVVASGGTGTLHYTWFKDDAQIEAPDQASLVLDNLMPSNAGLYYCVITDDAEGILTTPEASLQVSSSPIDISEHPEGGEQYPGEAFTFSIAASGGIGEFSYQWRRNSGAGFEDLPGADSATLALEDLQLSDAGVYRCRVTDEDNQSVQSFSATLLITERLSIVEQPQPVNAYFGSTVSFTVTTSGGIGQRTYVWMRDGQMISGNAPVLTLTNIDANDAGSYTCTVAAERDNEPTLPATLATGAQLQITTAPIEVTRIAGESYLFDADTTGGVGTVMYAWVKDSSPFRAVKTFNLGPLTVEDSGEYALVVADAVGTLGGNVLVSLTVEAAEGELPEPIHSADTDGDGVFSLTEMLRIIQLYNANAYYCDDTQPDGYAPGVSATAPQDCPYHATDYIEKDRILSLSELLRALQIFQIGSYWFCPSDGTEDFFCLGDAPGAEGE